jgi:hypothetical protein
VVDLVSSGAACIGGCGAISECPGVAFRIPARLGFARAACLVDGAAARGVLAVSVVAGSAAGGTCSADAPLAGAVVSFGTALDSALFAISAAAGVAENDAASGADPAAEASSVRGKSPASGESERGVVATSP